MRPERVGRPRRHRRAGGGRDRALTGRNRIAMRIDRRMAHRRRQPIDIGGRERVFLPLGGGVDLAERQSRLVGEVALEQPMGADDLQRQPFAVRRQLELLRPAPRRAFAPASAPTRLTTAESCSRSAPDSDASDAWRPRYSCSNMCFSASSMCCRDGLAVIARRRHQITTSQSASRRRRSRRRSSANPRTECSKLKYPRTVQRLADASVSSIGTATPGHNLQPALQVISPADAGTDESQVNPFAAPRRDHGLRARVHGFDKDVEPRAGLPDDTLSDRSAVEALTSPALSFARGTTVNPAFEWKMNPAGVVTLIGRLKSRPSPPSPRPALELPVGR